MFNRTALARQKRRGLRAVLPQFKDASISKAQQTAAMACCIG